MLKPAPHRSALLRFRPARYPVGIKGVSAQWGAQCFFLSVSLAADTFPILQAGGLTAGMLTEGAAVEIYKMKIALQQQRHNNAPVSIWGKTRSVARMFGVNSRTVKYVWNRLTWSHATEHLWASESEDTHISRNFQNRIEVRSYLVPAELCP
jgi:hypothetical protein